MLRLETECVTAVISCATLALNAAIEEVACVDLNSGLSGRYLKNASGLWVMGFSSHDWRCAFSAIQYPIVIVTLAEFQLLVVLLNALSNSVDCREIEWRALYCG